MSCRVIIGGGPRTGKSTLASLLEDVEPFDVLHTDDLIDLGWSGASAEAAAWMERPAPWFVEGVATVRALRKALDRPGAPCDLLVWLREPRGLLNQDQVTMAKGCETILTGIRSELEARGVRIVEPAIDEPLDWPCWTPPARR